MVVRICLMRKTSGLRPTWSTSSHELGDPSTARKPMAVALDAKVQSRVDGIRMLCQPCNVIPASKLAHPGAASRIACSHE
eukprot:scaffold14472_cov115-Isochrysis_galbana.AAC.7